MFRSGKSKEDIPTDNNMLKREPPNEKHRMLPYYKVEYKPEQSIIEFESPREVLMKENDKLVVKMCFERIYYMMECKSYMKNGDIPENKETFVYGFKHVKTDKVDK